MLQCFPGTASFKAQHVVNLDCGAGWTAANSTEVWVYSEHSRVRHRRVDIPAQVPASKQEQTHRCKGPPAAHSADGLRCGLADATCSQEARQPRWARGAAIRAFVCHGSCREPARQHTQQNIRTDLGGTPQAAGIAAVALPRAIDALVVREEFGVVSDHTAQAAKGLAAQTSASDLDSLRRPNHGATVAEARAPLPRIGWRVDGPGGAHLLLHS